MHERGGTGWWGRLGAAVAAIGLIFGLPTRLAAYSVLSHEAIIDSAWSTSIQPLLLKRFPGATAAELNEAHGYAYGGAIIQDMGYYPHGNRLFTDLTHYVRSGDFVLALLRDSSDLDEYAFALGALSHYAADNQGHRIGVNASVPLLYPNLERIYGSLISYEDNPLAHVKTEFGFDVLEVAKARYAPQSYHDFIGFGVSTTLLAKAFQETYGLELASVLTQEQKVLGSYRHDVSQLIPRATRIAWSLKKDEIQQDEPGITKRRFIYNISRASYRRDWGKDYKGPSLFDRFLAFLVKIIPKIGPLKILQFRSPTPETQRLFEASFNATLARYRELLKEVASGNLSLPNVNLDVGTVSEPGAYWLKDRTQAELLDALAKRNFTDVPPAVRSELIDYFGDPTQADSLMRKPKEWEKVQQELDELRRAAPSTAGAGLNLPPD